MRWALVLAVAAAALLASGASAATVECAGIPTCIDVPGPWVAVPASGEAKFLLDCPQRRGVVGGVDALASSRHIHVTFEGLLGGPVAPGRTTTRYAFFRAVSGNHREGLFEPRIGCIPSSAGGPTWPRRRCRSNPDRSAARHSAVRTADASSSLGMRPRSRRPCRPSSPTR